jgi:Rha family phage regulatory protein
MANNALWRSVALCTTRNRDILTLNEQVVAPPFDGKNVFAISQGLYKHAVFKLNSTPVKAYIVRFYCPDFDNKLIAWGYPLSSIKSLLRFENNLGMSDVSALSGLYPYANYKHCYGEYVTVAGEIVMSYTALMARLTPKYRNRFSSTGGTMRILEYIAQLGDKMGLDRSWQSSPFLSGDTFDAVDDVDEELDDSVLDDDCVPPAPTVKANPPVEVITSDGAMDEDVMSDDTTDEHVVLVDENEEGAEISTSTALVRIDENQQVIVDSLMIAQQFSRRHKDVLLTISRLNCRPEFAGRNFVPGTYSDKNNQSRPLVTMTRDGCVFLVSKLKGSEAGVFLERYIEAFNSMESRLSKPSSIQVPVYSPHQQPVTMDSSELWAKALHSQGEQYKAVIDSQQQFMERVIDKLIAKLPTSTALVPRGRRFTGRFRRTYS